VTGPREAPPRGAPPAPPPLPEMFRRFDESPDADFYAFPRFVTHIDDAAIAAVTALYRERLPAGGDVLDLMSSWVSHLPPDVTYRRVVGLGMNAEELGANPQLDARVVHDLNRDPWLPFAEGEFDAATICVSIDYLVRPVAVLRDLGRVVRAGGPLIIMFSNRCFPTKVIAAWLELDGAGRLKLVEAFLREAGNWEAIESRDLSPAAAGDPLLAVLARRAASGERGSLIASARGGEPGPQKPTAIENTSVGSSRPRLNT
jgi:SAM-dependent methyltransferase